MAVRSEPTDTRASRSLEGLRPNVGIPSVDEQFENFRSKLTPEQKLALEKKYPAGSGIAVIASPDAVVDSTESYDNSSDGVCIAESPRRTLTNLTTNRNGGAKPRASSGNTKK